jgi:hypothetical protein
MIQRIKNRIKDGIHWWTFVRSRGKWARHDLEKKKPNITEKLTHDEIKNISSFWCDYLSPKRELGWFAFYKSMGHEYDLSFYVPDDFYYAYVDGYFSSPEACRLIDDKNLYDLLFHDVPRPRTIARSIDGIALNADFQHINMTDFVNLCYLEGSVILKKAVNSEGGKGITFFDASKDDKVELIAFVKESKNICVQEVIRQHQDLSKLHPKSVNTIRIISLFFEDEVHILSSVVRMGVGEAKVDNASSGGIVCGVESSGRLKPEAFDVMGNRYGQHPSGVRFESVTIPHFDQCLDLCRKYALRLVQFSKLLSWDFAISEDGNPLLIEVNMSFGEIDFHQMCNGPLFGDLTPRVMKMVLEGNKMLSLRVFK